MPRTPNSRYGIAFELAARRRHPASAEYRITVRGSRSRLRPCTVGCHRERLKRGPNARECALPPRRRMWLCGSTGSRPAGPKSCLSGWCCAVPRTGRSGCGEIYRVPEPGEAEIHDWSCHCSLGPMHWPSRATGDSGMNDRQTSACAAPSCGALSAVDLVPWVILAQATGLPRCASGWQLYSSCRSYSRS